MRGIHLTEAERQAKQERAARDLAGRCTLSVAALAIAMLMVAGAAGFFWWKSQGRTVRAQEATKEARAQRAQAEEQFLAASVNLARAHEEKAVGIVSQPEDKCSTSDYQGALLQALQSQRWVPPNPGLGSPVYALAFSPDGRLFASATGNTVRLWDRRAAWLLIDNAAPSPRAALMSEVLQRRWGLRFNRLDLVPETWNWLLPRNGYHTAQEVAFDIRPLLDPPPPGKDKLDQLLDWLAEQEPRLDP